MRRALVGGTLFTLALAGCRFELTRELPPGELRGRVSVERASGGSVGRGPAKGAVVRLRGSSYVARVAADGRFVFRRLAPGSYAVQVQFDGDGDGTPESILTLRDIGIESLASGASRGRPGGRDLGELLLADAGSVEGRLVSDGKPVAGAVLSVLGRDGRPDPDLPVAKSGEGGLFRLPFVPAGRVTVHALFERLEGTRHVPVSADSEPVDVAPHAVRRAELTLPAPSPVPAAAVSGHIAAFDGVDEAQVTLVPDGGGPPLATTSGGGGAFSFTDVPAGSYSLVASATGYANVVTPGLVVQGDTDVGTVLFTQAAVEGAQDCNGDGFSSCVDGQSDACDLDDDSDGTPDAQEEPGCRCLPGTSVVPGPAGRPVVCAPPPDPCAAGACVCEGASLCGEACVDTANDAANCGSCGARCPAEQICAGSACAPSAGPVKISVTAPNAAQAGFGAQVQVTAKVDGLPEGASPTWTWTQVSGPPSPLTGMDTLTPKFTTRTLEEILAPPALTDLVVPPGSGVLPVSMAQMNAMSYVYRITVSAPPWQASGSILVHSVPRQGTGGVVSVGQRVVVYGREQGTWSWSLSGPGNSGLADAGRRFATFIPWQPGAFQVLDGVSGVSFTVTAARYAGFQSCQTCHASLPGSTTAPWASSRHATSLARGLDGAFGPGFGGNCVRCHEVGERTGHTYGQSRDDAGFYRAAEDAGWAIPSSAAPGTWQSVPDTVKALSNVQCENCHGPGSEHRGSSAGSAAPVGDGPCAACHDAPPKHDRVMLSQLNAHARRDDARGFGSVDVRQAGARNCARCHTTQGFLEYLAQMAANPADVGVLDNRGAFTTSTPNAEVITWLRGLGLGDDHVEPIGCVACHEPHGGGVRLAGQTPLLASGIRVPGAGKGTVCIVCHTSRDGLHEDPAAPADWGSPREETQADVLAGRNAYFLSGDHLSRHALIGDSCVTCHMQKAPPDTENIGLAAGYVFRGTNHTFRTTMATCGICHAGADFGREIPEMVRTAEDDATLAAATKLLALMAPLASGDLRVRAWDPVRDVYSSPNVGAPAVAASNVALRSLPAAAAVRFERIHATYGVRMTLPAPGVDITWSDDTVSTGVTELHFPLQSIVTGTSNTAVIALNTDLVRGIWNLLLVDADGSHGVHNPSLVREVLRVTAERLRQGP